MPMYVQPNPVNPPNAEQSFSPAILPHMTSVTPVFTEYERRVVHEIARHQFAEHPHVQGLFLGEALPQFVLVVALEDLVVGQAGDLQIVVDKALGDRAFDRQPLHVGF